MTFELRSEIAPDGQFEGVAIADAWIRPGADAEALREALAPWLAPCDAELAARMVLHLRSLTARREQAFRDDRSTIAAFVDEMRRYPVDVVRAACRSWVDGQQFFPAWAELKALCDKGVRGRRAVQRALDDRRDPLTKLAERLAPWRSDAHGMVSGWVAAIARYVPEAEARDTVASIAFKHLSAHNPVGAIERAVYSAAAALDRARRRA